MRSNTPAAWTLILAVWIATPFIGDRLPSFAYWSYGLLLAAAVGFGLYTAWKTRSWFLAVMAVSCLAAWAIILVVGLALFGV